MCRWSNKCYPGCFNHDPLPFTPRRIFTVDELFRKIMEIEGIDGVTFSGGEPLEQAEQLAKLARLLRKQNLNIMSYTGYTWLEIERAGRDDWNAYLPAGPYVAAQVSAEPWISSSDQQVIYLNESMRPSPEDQADTVTEYHIGRNGSITIIGNPTIGADAGRW